MDDWSDDEDFFDANEPPSPPSDLPTALRRIDLLEKKLAQAQQDMSEYRTLVRSQFDARRLAEIVNEPGPSSTEPIPRDDDSHYFSSYSENGASHPRIVLQT